MSVSSPAFSPAARSACGFLRSSKTQSGSHALQRSCHSSLHYLLQIAQKLFAQLRSAQRILHRRLQIALLIANVITTANKVISIHRLLLRQHLKRIGELNFTATSRCSLLQNRKYFRGNNITPQHSQPARRFLHRRLLHHVVHLKNTRILRRLARHNAIGRNLLLRHSLTAQHACSRRVINVQKLLQARLFLVIHHVVAQKHSERLITYERLRAQNRVPQALRLLLTNIMQIDIANLLHHRQQLVLAMLAQVQLQLQIIVEMILNRALVMPGDDQNILDSRSQCLFNDILNRRLIYNRQHLLRTSLRRRQKACA